MRRKNNRKTEPADLPIDLATAKDWIKAAPGTDADAELTLTLQAIRDTLPGQYNIEANPCTRVQKMTGFPADGEPIPISIRPASAITSIKYFDGAGVEQTLDAANYEFDTADRIPKIYPVPRINWPAVDCDRAWPVSIEYAAGFATVPYPIQQAAKFLLQDWNRERGEVVIGKAVNKLSNRAHSLLMREALITP